MSRRAAQRRTVAASGPSGCASGICGSAALARPYRTPVGEIDLIARRGRTIAAIEVKARADDARAAEAILWKQRSRIARALEHFLKSRPDLGDAELRFDVMLVASRRWPRHLRDAWRAGE